MGLRRYERSAGSARPENLRYKRTAYRAAASQVVQFAGRAGAAYANPLRDQFGELVKVALAAFDNCYPVDGLYVPMHLSDVRIKLEVDISAYADRVARDLRLSSPAVGARVTGWARVERALADARASLSSATTEEQFQAIGLTCREVLNHLGNAVHDPTLHPRLEERIEPSATDGKRKLEGFVAANLAGRSSEPARKFARAAVDLGVALHHRPTATFREASSCVEATAAVAAFIAAIGS